MAYIVTATLLIDEANELDAYSTFLGLVEPFVGASVIDFSSERISKTNTVIDDLVTNGTYQAGDFESGWVIFSPTKNQIRSKGYWSEEYGWTDKDLATIYGPEEVKMPEGVDDAVLMMRNVK